MFGLMNIVCICMLLFICIVWLSLVLSYMLCVGGMIYDVFLDLMCIMFLIV